MKTPQMIQNFEMSYKKIQMDNNKSQQMQNWKKMIIMDPLLNNLFDQGLNVKDFIHEKILTQDHQQIVNIYSKLSSVKHAISKQIQKEVEIKHETIEQSFVSKHRVTSQLKVQNLKEIEKMIKSVKEFNENYDKVREDVTKLENVNRVIRFSKGLEKFKINCRLLKTFMKDFNSSSNLSSNLPTSPNPYPRDQQPSPIIPNNSTSSCRSLPSVSTSSSESLNLQKVSKLIKELTDLTSKFDFSGIKYFQNEKHFINSAKEILFGVTEKLLTKSLAKWVEITMEEVNVGKRGEVLVKNGGGKSLEERLKGLEEDIREKFKVLNAINKLKEFIPAYCKKILLNTSEILKSLFECPSIESFANHFLSIVYVTVLSNAKLLITLEEILRQTMLSKSLTTANLPNLFQKYMQRLVSYFGNLINWNLQQDAKQADKRRLTSKTAPFLQLQTQMRQLIKQNQNPKQKLQLIYKYPSLYAGLSMLLSKIHQEVLLKAEYNKAQYEFSVKKQQVMGTLLPISRRFYAMFEEIVGSGRVGENENDSVERCQWVGWFYEQVVRLKMGSGGKISRGIDTTEVGVLLESLNEKLLSHIQNLHHNQQHTTDNQQLITSLVSTIDRKQIFKCYSSLQRVIDHIKRVKTIKKSINVSKQSQNQE